MLRIRNNKKDISTKEKRERYKMSELQENVKQEENSEIQQSKKWSDKMTSKQCKITGIIGAIAAVVLIVIGVYNMPTQKIARQLSLGYQYLESQQYEEAIVAFSNAVAIDEKCLEAYVAGIEAYKSTNKTEEMQLFYDNALEVTQSLDAEVLAHNQINVNTLYLSADEVYENDNEKAVHILEEGLVLSGDNEEIKKELMEQYKELAKEYTQEEKYAESLDVYDKLLQMGEKDEALVKELEDCLTQNVEQLIKDKEFEEAKVLVEKYKNDENKIQTEELTALIEEKEKMEAENIAFMQKIYDLMAAEDYSTMQEVDESEETDAFVARMEEESYIYIPEDNTGLNGIGAGVYKYDEDDYYFFYGNYVNGERTGQGTSIERGENDYSVFTGEWQKDAPNGYGKVVVKNNLEGTGDTSEEISEGNLKNGLWDGHIVVEIQVLNSYDRKLYNYDLSFDAVNGVPTEDRNEEFHTTFTVRGMKKISIEGTIYAFDVQETSYGWPYWIWNYIKPGETLGVTGFKTSVED